MEHREKLKGIGVNAPEIRLPCQLDDLDGLIIPGGESTTIAKFIDIYEFRQALKDRINSGLPAWGTCAGMILLANRLMDDRPEPLHAMNIEVSRNAFGSQVDRFETDLVIDQVKGPPFHAVFIRAPIVTALCEPARPLATLGDGRVVAVEQGRLLATAFHPELTDDNRIHKLFVGIVEDSAHRPYTENVA